MKTATESRFSGSLDSLDREVLLALHADGRASWSRIASGLGVSAPTVKRRYEALHREGIVRVVAATDVSRLGLGQPFIVRFSHVGSLPELIARLQKRREVRFAASVLGSCDLVAEIVLPHDADYAQVVAELRGSDDVEIASSIVTHAFTSGQNWRPGPEADHAVIAPERASAPEIDLSWAETTVLGMLMHDGRASLADLAAAISRSENTVTRTIDGLMQKGVLEFRVLVEPAYLGKRTELMLWVATRPADADAVALRLAAQPSTKYLAATTGGDNLVAQVVIDSNRDLHNYSSQVLGSIPEIIHSELSVQVNTYKRVWTSINAGRYASRGRPLDLLDYLHPPV